MRMYNYEDLLKIQAIKIPSSQSVHACLKLTVSLAHFLPCRSHAGGGSMLLAKLL